MTAEGRSLLRGLSLFSAHLDLMLPLRYLNQPTNVPVHHRVSVKACVGIQPTCVYAPGSTSG